MFAPDGGGAQEYYVILLAKNEPLLHSAMASRPPLQLQFTVQGGKKGRHLVVSVCVDGTRPLKS